MTAVLSTSACLSGPRYHGPVTEHFDGTTFRNPDVVPVARPAGGLVSWLLHRKHGVWHVHRGEQPGPAPVAVSGSSLTVTWVGHSTLLVQMEGLSLLTDPIWSERAGPASWLGERRKREPGIRFEDLPRIDVVLLSHNHYDHCDLPTLERLWKRDRPAIFTGLGNARLLARHGIEAHEMDWWDSAPVAVASGASPARVTCVPARHFSGRGLADRNATLWAGFVVEGPGGSFYFAGDTAYGSHFAAIAQRFPTLRLALLPIGSYEPRWFMKSVHMNPADAVQAFADLGAGRAVGIHFGTFDQTDEGEDDPALALSAALDSAGMPHERFQVPRFGLPIAIPPFEAENRNLR